MTCFNKLKMYIWLPNLIYVHVQNKIEVLYLNGHRWSCNRLTYAIVGPGLSSMSVEIQLHILQLALCQGSSYEQEWDRQPLTSNALAISFYLVPFYFGGVTGE